MLTACRGFWAFITSLSFALNMWAQQGPQPPGGPPQSNHPPPYYGNGPGSHQPPPREGAPNYSLHTGPPGKWWVDPAVVAHLGITADQQKRMEALFQENRLRFIDLTAALDKENAILEPLLQPDRPDEARILAQIDRIAQARAELEKANARFLLGIRNILTPEQWRRLQAEHSGPQGDDRHGGPAPPPYPHS